MSRIKTPLACRLPVGGPKGGQLELTLSRAQFEAMSGTLWQRARLPLDQVEWVGGLVYLRWEHTLIRELRWMWGVWTECIYV